MARRREPERDGHRRLVGGSRHVVAARCRDRRRRHPDGAPRPRSTATAATERRRDRQPARGARGGGRGLAGGDLDRGPRAPHRGRPFAPLPRPLVRHRPRLARAPSPRAGRRRRVAARDGARGPARHRGQRPGPEPARAGSGRGSWATSPRGTGTRDTTRRCRSGAPIGPTRWRRSSRTPASPRSARSAGPLGQRYAIAARPGMSERVGIAIVGGGPSGAVLAARLAAAGEPVVVLERAPAWRWRAGGVFASPAAVAALRRAGLAEAVDRRGRPPDPGDARGDARRRRVPPDVRRRCRGRTGGRVRPVAAGSGLAGPRDARRCGRSRGLDASRAWTSMAASSTSVDPTADRSSSPRRSSSAPTGRIRSSPAAPVSRDRPGWIVASGSPSTCPIPTRTDAAMRGCSSFATGMSASRPSPAAGSTSGSCWARRGGRRSPGTGRPRSRRGSCGSIPPADDDPATWRGLPPTDAVAGAWPLGHRVTRRAGSVLAARRRRGGLPRPVHGRRAASRARVGGAGGGGDPGAAAAAGRAPSTPTTGR